LIEWLNICRTWNATSNDEWCQEFALLLA